MVKQHSWLENPDPGKYNLGTSLAIHHWYMTGFLYWLNPCDNRVVLHPLYTANIPRGWFWSLFMCARVDQHLILGMIIPPEKKKEFFELVISLQGGPLPSYKWSYKSIYRGYNPSYPVTSPFIGVITPFITGRGPPCRLPNILWGGIWTPNTYLKHLLRRYLED